MALTVGTDAYDTLANVDAYWVARGGTAWAAETDDPTREIYIRKATDYIDRNFTYIGDVATSTQRLKWPRQFAYVEGNEIGETVIPWQVEEATAIVADLFRNGTYDMEGIVTNDAAAVSMQKVDVITVAYDTSKRLQGKAVMSHVSMLLRPLTLGTGGLVRA
jgi:hypothetical protein